VAESDPLIGRVIDGRFTIQSVLGRGGMGVVYRAHQSSLERSVALKVMTGVPPEREAEFQRRFFLEAATAAKLKHPNTITVFDYGSSVVDGEKVFFIAMELLDGVPLQRLVGKGKALEPLRAVHIALQISRSLREAHAAGVVHRDLKPGNVMLVKQDDAEDLDADFVKVLDFGLAKVPTGDAAGPIEGLTKTGTFMGSPRYVAPEQVEGRVVDARADIYSLGCITYRMLTGRVPFDGKTPVEIMLKHLHDPVPKLAVPGLPLSLEKLVVDMLAKNIADRPQSMDAVMKRLKLVRAELGGTGSGLVAFEADALSQSQPPTPAIVDASDPRASSAEIVATRVDRKPTTQPSIATPTLDELRARVIVAEPIAHYSPSSSSSASPLARGGEDSTRPTRILQKLTARPPPGKKPWAAIALGVVLGLALCAAGASWRLGFVDQWFALAKPWLVEHGVLASTSPAIDTSSDAPPIPQGPLATIAMIKIVTEPAGADVLEVQGGLPRLLGVTPLTIKWEVDPHPRELLLRKEGFKPSTATIPPPAKADAEPVWLDVSAVLKAR
jgi:serine/threonine-protein kinase